MHIIKTVEALHQYLQSNPIESIGFVPTMGNLHAGHLRLVSQAKKLHDCVVVSIYVNRKQFNQQNDFDNYPNTIKQDAQKLEAIGADVLFVPNENEMYPKGIERSTLVLENTLTQVLCGATRPGHFEGVTTVVAKLLNIVQPDSIYLGEKDYQQYMVIKKMVQDLFMPCQVEVVPTVREDSGLAMSSRNNMLSAKDTLKTGLFRRPLANLKDLLLAQPDDINSLIEQTVKALELIGFKMDYLECRSNKDLSLYDGKSDIRQYRLFVAAFLGDVRLIDNLRVI